MKKEMSASVKVVEVMKKKAKKPKTAEQRAKKAAKRRAKREKRKAMSAQVGQLARVPQARLARPPARNSDEAHLFSLLDRNQAAELYAALRQILNPTSEIALLPRAIPAKVTTFPIIITEDVPYEDIAAGDPRKGVAGFEMYRNAQYPLHIWRTNVPSASVTLSCRFDKMGLVTGLWPGNGHAYDEVFETNLMELDNQDTANVVGLWKYSDDQSGFGVPGRKFRVSDGTYGYGVPLEVPTSLVVNFTCNSAYLFPVGQNFSMRLVSTLGTTAWVAGTALGAAGVNFLQNFTFSTARTDLGGQYACVLPDAPMGIQIRSDTGTVHLSAVAVSFPNASGVRIGRMVPQALSYVSDLSFGNQYRVSSLVATVKYDGSDLKNGGQIASISYPGGTPMTLAGYTGYEAIAGLSDKFIGPMKTGSNLVWRPYNLEDLSDLQLTDFEGPLSRSSMAWWVKIAETDQLNALKIVLVGTAEATTKSPVRTLRMCRMNPLAETMLIAMVQHYPAVTENPLHWGDIKDFLKRVKKSAEHAVGWYEENKSWIIPAVTSVAALI